MKEPVYHVLLLEDSSAIRERSKSLLAGSKLAEFVTHEAVTLAQGLEILSTSPVDAVLLDLGLPDSGGLATVRAVRAAAPQTAIVVLTADDSDATVLEALKEGTQDYLLKDEISGPMLQRTLRYAVELKRLEDDLRRRAEYDVLTGLFTRRKVMEDAVQAVDEACRTGLPLSLAMADVDGLKGVNDTFGHREGDEVLEAFGQTLSKALRGRGFAGRWGGDEFLVVFPGTPPKEASLKALEMVSAFSALTFESSHGEKFSVSCTFGIAGIDHTLPDAKELMRAADSALYEGKRSSEPVVVK